MLAKMSANLFNMFYYFLLKLHIFTSSALCIHTHIIVTHDYYEVLYILYAFVKSRHHINRQTFPQTPMSVSPLNKPRILTVSFKKYHRFTLSLQTFSASEIHYPTQNSCLSCVPTPYSRQLFCEIVHLRIGVHEILKNKRW